MHDIAAWADLLLGQYIRHFAGQTRGDRDTAVLRGILEDVEAVHQELVLLHNDEARELAASMTANAAGLRQELEALDEVRQAMDGPTLLSNARASVADLDRRFLFHADGQPTVAKSGTVLTRMRAGYQLWSDPLNDAWKRGYREPALSVQLQELQEKKSRCETQLLLVTHAVERADSDALVQGWATAWQRVKDTYASDFEGKSRTSCDVFTISMLCDELMEIVRAVRVHAQEDDDPYLHEFLGVMLDHAVAFQHEFEEIYASQHME